ncbi:MAG: outer membrane beta-barrel family protein, partial [Muribaculaceae bacterium]|nr:outer membrane beta-barrel family protein [Muribaculaceae bacterium]
GIGFTDIFNSSKNYMNQIADGIVESNESNDFDYRERIASGHISASRSLGNHIWGKIGLRYEYTWTKSHQLTTMETDRSDYGRLFPTLNISYNADKIGSFNVSYSMGMGRPNLWELNPFRYYSTTDEYAAGNVALKPTIYNNAEVNYYGLGGLYAVLYTSFASDAIGYIRRFDSEGVVSTLPYNCLSTNKTGLFASYRRNITDWWEMNVGGEIYHTYSHSDFPDFKIDKMDDWSGKIEISANCMLNRQKTLTFNARFTHFFPWQQNMVSYESFQLFNLTLRYSMLKNKLNMHITANDIFGWNKTKSKEHYADYTIRHIFNHHSAYVLFGINFTFGRDKVSGVWRDSKENQSGRTK